MIKKLIDTNDLKLLEISGLTIYGKGVSDETVKYMPEFPALILNFLAHMDNEYEKYINMIPHRYNAIIFPVDNKVYAAFFPKSKIEKAYNDVMAYMAQLYPNKVYIHEFRSLCAIEDLIKSRIITKTEKSALYKSNNMYWYVTNDSLIRLSEFCINSRLLPECFLSKYGEKIIGKDAYSKILSYVDNSNSIPGED